MAAETPDRATPPHRLLVGYDGSPGAIEAIEIGARLVPHAAVWILHLWSPPFASPELRRRLRPKATSLDELMRLLEREGSAQADRLAATGVVLARAAGWEAEALPRRIYGGEGLELARRAEELDPEAVVLGSRGLSGVSALLGSVSDLAVHYSPAPVLVVPHPQLSDEREFAANGPVLIGYDGSSGARNAVAAAVRLFGGRELLVAAVGDADADTGAGVELARAEGAAAEELVLEGGGPASGGGRAVADALGECATARRAALIVVGSRGRSATRKILLGSVAMAVLHHAQRPVLVVPPERQSLP